MGFEPLKEQEEPPAPPTHGFAPIDPAAGDVETYFREETGNVIAAPSGLSGPHVEFLDDTQNNGKEAGRFMGFVDVGADTTTNIVKGFIRSGPAGVGRKILEAQFTGSELALEGAREDPSFSPIDLLSQLLPGARGSLSAAKVREKFGEEGAVGMEVEELKKTREQAKAGLEKMDVVLDKMGLKKIEGNVVSDIGFDVGAGAGSFIELLGMSAILKSPKDLALFLFVEQKGGKYVDAREKGQTINEADLSSNLRAGSSAVINTVGIGLFNKMAQSSKGVAKFIGGGLNEAVEEGTEETADIIITNTQDLTNISVSEGVGRVAYASLIGAIVGAPIALTVESSVEVGKQEGVPEDVSRAIANTFFKKREEADEIVSQMVADEVSQFGVDEAPLAEARKLVTDFANGKEIEVQGLGGESGKQVPPLFESRSTVLQKDDGVPITLFHSTTAEQDFAGFDLSFTGTGTDQGNLGVGVYLSPVRSIAEATTKGQGRTIETNAFIENPIEIIRDDSFIQNIENLAQELGVVTKPVFSGTKQQSAEFAKEFSDKAQAAGFDSVIVRAPNKARDIAEVVVFDPQNVDIIPEFAPEDSPQRVRPNVELQKILSLKRPSRVREGGQRFKEGFDKGIERAIVPISTRLKRISPKLKGRLRRFEGTLLSVVKKDSDAILPYLEGVNNLPQDEKIALDFAMMNGDQDLVDLIAERNGLTDSIATLRKTLDDIYARAKKSGLDLEYRENFFPRVVKNHKKLVEHFESDPEVGNLIVEAIMLKEQETQQTLSVEEKAHLINTLLRGYNTSQITLSKPGALKERNIDTVTSDIFDFYMPTDQAILRYVSTVNESIEARTFFGKTQEGLPTDTILDSIGAFALKEVQDGNIKATDLGEVSDILKARFAKGQMNEVLRIYKNFSYIDTMGSPTSAITQISDLSFAMSNAGVYNTLRVLPRAIINKSEITTKDVGINNIAQEFDGYSLSSKGVQVIFKIVGLEKMDRIGKQVLMNSALLNHRKAAKNPTPEYKANLELIFEGETDQLMQDLRDGVNSENVKLLVVNDLMEFQPIALSEMPETYLRSPNGRIFYMLKTFTIKQFDIYRNQVFDEIRAGNTAKGLGNLARLSFFFVVMNAGADFLKDLLLGRETDPEDMVVNNILRLFGISKYVTYQARREGLGSAITKIIAPPFKFINALFKDMFALAEGGKDLDDLQVVSSIPVAGKLYYWWFGAKGGDKKKSKKRSAKGFDL